MYVYTPSLGCSSHFDVAKNIHISIVITSFNHSCRDYIHLMEFFLNYHGYTH